MKAKTLFINLIIIIVLLGIIELVCRAVLSRVYNRGFDSSLIEERKYGSSDGLKANANGTMWGQQFSTDELGGRKTASINGKNKRLYIGDSVTEGVGVDDSSTFAYKMSAIDTAYDVRNISLIGYSTGNYINVIRHYIGRDTTIASVDVFYCLNDVYGKSRSRELPVMYAQRSFKSRVNAFLQGKYATYTLLKLWVYQNSDAYYRYDESFYENDTYYFKQAKQCLLKCDSICKENGIAFNIVILPYRSQIEDSTRRLPQNEMAKFCKENGLSYSDALPYLAANSKPKELYLFADEIHFSVKGHQKIAEYLQTIGF